MRKVYYGSLSIDEGSSLDEVKRFRQEQNKGALASFLASASVEFGGKQYGVQEEDQNEMQAMVMQYQTLTAAGIETELLWHAKHEACRPFTIEEMAALVMQVKAFVLPHQTRMQEIKARIYAAQSAEEVMGIAVFAP